MSYFINDVKDKTAGKINDKMMFYDDKNTHVIPNGDVIDHWSNTSCWCQPTSKVVEGNLIVTHRRKSETPN